MRKTLRVETDVLILGHGASGLFSGAILSSYGKRVMIAGEGATSTSLSTGNIVFLRDLNGSFDENKYGETAISEALIPYMFNEQVNTEFIDAEIHAMTSFLFPRLNACGLALNGSIDKNQVLLTNAGFPYPCTFAQIFASKGDLGSISEKDVALLGFLGYKDFDPDVAAIIISRIMNLDNISAYWTQVSEFKKQCEMHAAEVAHLAHDDTFQEGLADAMKDIDCDLIGIPPVFSLLDYQMKMTELEKETGREIFEVVTPLSLPGLRFHEALKFVARREGCRLSEGLNASSLRMVGRRAESAILKGRFIDTEVKFDCLIVCTGGLIGGGLIANGNKIVDSIGIFQVEEKPDPIHCNTKRKLHSPVQMIARYGLKTDSSMHLYLKDGERLENVLGAGSALRGCSFSAGLGLGGVLFTAWLSAQKALEVL